MRNYLSNNEFQETFIRDRKYDTNLSQKINKKGFNENVGADTSTYGREFRLRQNEYNSNNNSNKE